MLVSHILSNSFLKDTSQAKFFRIILVLIVYLICSGNRNAHLYELKFANHMIFFPIFKRSNVYRSWKYIYSAEKTQCYIVLCLVGYFGANKTASVVQL